MNAHEVQTLVVAMVVLLTVVALLMIVQPRR